MALINLKFYPEMEEQILQGKKCCTTRDEKKGEPDDVFRVGNRIYRILQISSYDVSGIAHLYKLEGFEYRHHFLKAIEEIYPNIYDRCDNIVYAHFFAYFGRACDDFGYSGQCIAKETCKVGEWCSKKKMVHL